MIKIFSDVFYRLYKYLNKKEVRKRILTGDHELNLLNEENKFIDIEHEAEKKNYMRRIKNIIIHCSDSEFGNASIIRKWHTDPPRSWRDIGYHYCICNGKYNNNSYDISHDGIIEPGRSINSDPFIDSEEKGAHAKYFNRDSIGVCMIGKDKFTPKQFEALAYVVKYWQKLIDGLKIIGHCEINSGKTCPNIDMDIIRTYINNITFIPDIQIYFNRYIH